jgi:N-acetylglucosaminyldiphosphoundecaprenol N-acetyl-beta-D-mannosaminyltransferase
VSYYLLSMKLDPTSYQEATKKIIAWSKAGEPRTICAASAHMVIEAYDSLEVRDAINSIDLVVSDGMPLVWWLRAKGVKNQPRVYGPELMLHICRAAADQEIPVGFLGSSPEVITALVKRLSILYPRLPINFIHSPPFRPLSIQEDEEITQQINGSGIKILFVGLGCPKQERWIADHKDRVHAVMFAVGAAFQFHAGIVHQAPQWIQRMGMEWLYRTTQEPGRLWKRYISVVPRFSYLVILEVLGLL